MCFNLRFESEDDLAAIAAGMVPDGTDAVEEPTDDVSGTVPSR